MNVFNFHFFSISRAFIKCFYLNESQSTRRSQKSPLYCQQKTHKELILIYLDQAHAVEHVGPSVRENAHVNVNTRTCKSGCVFTSRLAIELSTKA